MVGGAPRVFLKLVAGFILAGSAIYLLALHVFAPEQTARAAAIATLLPVGAAGWLLISRGRIRLATWMLAIGIWTQISVAAYYLGGLGSTATILYPLMILSAGWLFGTRAAAALALLTAAVALALALAQSWGVLPPALPTHPVVRWVLDCVAFGFSAVLIGFVVRSYRERVEEVRRLGSDLAASSADLSRAQAVAHVGSWVYELAADMMHLSAETCRIFGLPEGTKGSHESYLARVHPDDRVATERAWQAALAGGAAFDHEHRIRAGKDIRWVRQIAVFDRDAQGRPLRSVGTTQDITERKQAEEVMLLHVSRYRTVVETSGDGFWVVDETGHLRDVNEAYVRRSGYTRDKLLGMHVYDLDAAETPADAAAHIRAIAGKGGDVFETLHRTKDGRLWPVEVSVSYRADQAEPMLCFVRDISERIRVQGELRTLSRALEQSPVSVLITDRAGNIEYVNPRFEHVTGYTRAEAVGKNPRILQSGSTPAQVYKQLWATIAAGGDWRGELCNRRKGGELYWELASISGVMNDKGEIEHYIAVKEDITERKRASEALQESESRFSAIFHTSPIAISVSRLVDGLMLDVNEAALRIFGLTRNEVIGCTAAELGICADLSQRDELLQRLREQGQLERFELDIRASGGMRKLEVTGRAIELRGERWLVAMMVDVTERKQLEQMHLQAQKLESLGTLTAGIAHDFNNILAAICGNADLAAEDVGPGHPAMESLEEIRKAGARASELVRRIMAFGRPKETRQQLVDLNDLVEEVLKLLRSTMPAGISLTRKFSRSTPRVRADAGQVHEAVVNLTTNAAYAIGRRAGSIEYRLEPVQISEERANSVPGLVRGLYACLTVTDTGSGMDATTMQRIFDAFYTTKPVGEGTGLGLSMVHGTMKSHGGAVTVTSVPGKGSSFSLYFPAASEGGAREDNDADAGIHLTSGKRVLYIDDEEALVLLASRVLSRLGHKIYGFTDPAEALKAFRARAQDFDIVVTDLSMPKMSGFDLAREVLSTRPNIPILITTGYVAAEDEAHARTLGIRELILKPATMEEFGRALDRQFGAPEDGG